MLMQQQPSHMTANMWSITVSELLFQAVIISTPACRGKQHFVGYKSSEAY